MMARPHFLGDLEMVVAIREMAAAGMTYTAIGHEFFVSHVAVSDIVNGNSYRDVGGPIRYFDWDTEGFFGRERARR